MTYLDLSRLSIDMIEAVFPADNEGNISPVSLKCKITRGGVTYKVKTDRDESGAYDSTISSE
ncbi:hypothetical protein [Huintestinicola sp.]|uniref:hypothetical protein n=1 Tax=Huintestinicola sp. TaxID=2981661 RepID=UPI003D7E07C4